MQEDCRSTWGAWIEEGLCVVIQPKKSAHRWCG